MRCATAPVAAVFCSSSNFVCRLQSLQRYGTGSILIGRRSYGATSSMAGSTTKRDVLDAQIANIRNIGIVAHIDAGKTTTTERMLFYSGVTKRVGDVDSGTTTTDFMEEEMERGITITSAAVSLSWKDHRINLIDTPGHVDFTVEVERALRVVDGVVALFDASAGVQAQSYTVLRQARKFNVPVIAFLNKMDKPNANFTKSVASIEAKLAVEPLLVQLPLHGEDGAFEGIIDLIDQTALRFSGVSGSQLEASLVVESLPQHLIEATQSARHCMMTQLTNRDDTLSERLIEALDKTDGDETAAEALISPADIRSAIRRHVAISPEKLKGRPLVPILCGASRRDQGVQPLLDAVNAYLPSPLDRTNLTGFAEDGSIVPLPKPSNQPTAATIALAFKVMHTTGPTGGHDALVFFRVYCGMVVPKARLMNHSNPQRKTEVIEKLFVMHANTPIEVPAVTAGSIGAAFLKHTSTGDTLYAEPQVQRLYEKRGALPEPGDSPLPLRTLEGIQAPPPAISFSIEAANARQIPLMEEALAALQKEDPSLRTSKNVFGQLVISGMGELHLEIIMSRLEREYQLKCKLLRAIIEYRETILAVRTVSNLTIFSNELPLLEVDLEWVPMMASDVLELDPLNCESEFLMTVECADDYGTLGNGGGSTSSASSSGSKNSEKTKNGAELDMLREAFSTALEDCCRSGPMATLPVVGVKLVATRIRKRVLALNEKSLLPAVRSAVANAMRDGASLRKKDFCILEPMMAVEVHLTEPTYIGDVIASMNEKNATSVDIMEDGRSVSAVVPMRNIVRYTMDLRKSAKGNANFFAKLHHYRVIEDQGLLARVLKNLGVAAGP